MADEPSLLWSSISKVIELALAAAFGSWAWVVHHFGDASLRELKEINSKVNDMEKQMFINSQRISKIEGQLEK